MSDLVKVKRDGGKGYRLIERSKFNAGGYEEFTESEPRSFEVQPDGDNGFFKIMSGNDVMVTGLSKDDAEAFEAMDSKEKADYVQACIEPPAQNKKNKKAGR